MARRYTTRLLLLMTVSSFVFVIGCSGPQQTVIDDPNVVAVIQGAPLTLADFEARYVRSIGDQSAAAADSLPAYVDFLNRYVDFRLKVLAAQDAGYATDSSILSEIRGYRTSFAKPFLLDKEVINPVIETLYLRRQEMVDASHILIRFPEVPTPADTLASYTRILALQDSLAAGADFGDLAQQYSEDPSARGAQGRIDNPGFRGRLGYFSAGRMVEPFEATAWSTPVGEVSDIIRTRFGYHLLYIHDRSPAIPDIRVSHILIRPNGTTAEDTTEALERIQTLATRIGNGENFSNLAKGFSDDSRSGVQGGDIGWMQFDNYNIVEPFRVAAFELENVGDLSDIVETRFGYHLIKLTEKKQPGSFTDEYENLKQMASRLPRTNAAENALKEDIIRSRQGAYDTTLVRNILDGTSPDSVLIRLSSKQFPDSLSDYTFASLGDSVYTWEDWSKFVATNQVPAEETFDEQVDALAHTFLLHVALDYEAAALEERDSEFRLIMEEFKDGLMLFKLMEDSVWTAAAEDSAALEAYFASHQNEYRFPDRTRIISLASANDSLLTSMVDRLDQGLSFADLAQELAQDSTRQVRMDTILVAGPTDSVYDLAVGLDEGTHTAPIRDRNGQTVLFNDGVEPSRLKTFSEARTEVVSGYQEVLEARLLEQLAEKYGVMKFPDRLTQAFQQPPEGQTADASN